MRQSHLTYYYPTRRDLLEAAADAAVNALLSDLASTLDGSSLRSVAKGIARVAVRAENTRLLMALAQAADAEPSVREAFRHLVRGVAGHAAAALGKRIPDPDPEKLQILHATSVGLAVISLATGAADGERRAAKLLEVTLRQLFPDTSPSARRAARRPARRGRA
jgi:AcrR family transcriptional regulator